MAIYKHILLAVDLHPEHDQVVISRAIEMAKANAAKLYIVHAFEGIHAYGASEGYHIIMQMEESLAAVAQKELNHLVSQYDNIFTQHIFEKGPAKVVILEQAKKWNIDLIIVGSHSRRGINILFDTTADGVTHHAPCDVLAVRVNVE